MRYDGSAWTFSDDERSRAVAIFGGTIFENPVRDLAARSGMEHDRQAAVAREQHALEALEGADPEFARAITAKLIPDRTKDRDVLRRTP